MRRAASRVGIAPGGNLSALYLAFGFDSDARNEILARHHRVLLDAWAGRELPGGDRLYPPNPGLVDRVWQATFNVEGARRAGAAGDGLMLSRTQPRPKGAPGLSLPEIQNPMIDAYLAALPPGRAPRILASRTVFVALTIKPKRCGSPNWGSRGSAARFAAMGRSELCRGHVGQ